VTSSIVIWVVAVTSGHPVAAAMVYVTVYVPGKDEFVLICPVVPFMVSPAVELNVPPVLPETTTDMRPAFGQNGDPLYDMVAAGRAVMVTLVVAVTAAQPPAAIVEYVTV